MRVSDALNGRCPRCGAPVTQDLSGKGWVRHKEYWDGCDDEPYGLGERDEPVDPDNNT
jgi:hypothetical protein